VWGGPTCTPFRALCLLRCGVRACVRAFPEGEEGGDVCLLFFSYFRKIQKKCTFKNFPLLLFFIDHAKIGALD